LIVFISYHQSSAISVEYWKLKHQIHNCSAKSSILCRGSRPLLKGEKRPHFSQKENTWNDR
jgi:hypothetical protein